MKAPSGRRALSVGYCQDRFNLRDSRILPATIQRYFFTLFVLLQAAAGFDAYLQRIAKYLSLNLAAMPLRHRGFYLTLTRKVYERDELSSRSCVQIVIAFRILFYFTSLSFQKTSFHSPRPTAFPKILFRQNVRKFFYTLFHLKFLTDAILHYSVFSVAKVYLIL